MKYAIDGQQCPSCGAVLKVLQSPWPHTGEWERYEARFCPHCGSRMDGKERR